MFKLKENIHKKLNGIKIEEEIEEQHVEETLKDGTIWYSIIYRKSRETKNGWRLTTKFH